MKRYYLDVMRFGVMELVTSTDFQKLLNFIQELPDEARWELKTFPSATLKQYYIELE